MEGHLGALHRGRIDGVSHRRGSPVPPPDAMATRGTAESSHMATGATDFDTATLRARRTNKWHKFPDDVLPAWVADMDFGVAPSITAALARLTRDQEYGYAAREGVLAAAFVRRMEQRFGWHTDPADTV